jgi:hypothetical protein
MRNEIRPRINEITAKLFADGMAKAIDSGKFDDFDADEVEAIIKVSNQIKNLVELYLTREIVKYKYLMDAAIKNSKKLG